ncbi:hypothetical protein [Leptospira haakeii]|uniref:Lipoprotein n=1 Tax=Leptospira haakeii TaxID=2023198 RepID=A0ABX4PMJ1_9LEPT|nr:hypothetical protein [Leptospira haakeii]PKA16855.1 hypothetical protein CH363_05515 [Leptospira haakeii]PKA19254.1 hypothetical protein CH377_13085 [Leptospira haakeii]
MKFLKILLIVPVLLLLTCNEEKKDIPNSLLFPLLQNVDLTPGTNLAQVSFDTFTADNQLITSCDVDNSSGQGIVVDLPDIFPSNYVVKIETVPSTSPFTFPIGGALDLYLGSSHKPDDPANCILTRTSSSFFRYSATLSTNCTVMNHTLSRLEIDCIPN